jgi:hypothetical protein
MIIVRRSVSEVSDNNFISYRIYDVGYQSLDGHRVFEGAAGISI